MASTAPSWVLEGPAVLRRPRSRAPGSTLRAPGITVVTPGCCITQASATWAGVAPGGRQRGELAGRVHARLEVDAGERLADVERLAVPVVVRWSSGREGGVVV